MTNAGILANSINQWASPILEGAINNMAQNSQIGYFMSSLISPQRLMGSLQNHIGVPMLMEHLSKLPDAVIPNFSTDLIDGMIEQRVKDGALQIPFLNIGLGADAFRNLKEICANNFREYGETQSENTVETTTKETAPDIKPKNI